LVLAFQTKQIKIPDETDGRFEKSDNTALFPGKVTKDSQNNPRAQVAIMGFKFDQKSTNLAFDVALMQVSVGQVTDNHVDFRVICEYRGKTEARWTGHINVLIIADIE
jgi:hypothetical protein